MLEAISKRLTARLAVLAIAAAGVLAAAPAQAEYRGGGIIHSFMGCSAVGWDDGDADNVRARYSPSEVFGSPSRVSLFFPSGGALHLTTGAAMEPGRTRYRGTGMEIFRTAWFWPNRPRIRVAYRQVVLPRNGTFENAMAVDMGLIILGFGGDPACSAQVDLSLYRRD